MSRERLTPNEMPAEYFVHRDRKRWRRRILLMIDLLMPVVMPFVALELFCIFCDVWHWLWGCVTPEWPQGPTRWLSSNAVG